MSTRASASRLRRPVNVAAGFIAILAATDVMAAACNGTNTWPPCLNPTATDSFGNTAGGTGTLQSLISGGDFNTGFGWDALVANQTGSENSAFGYEALFFNTASQNTATGFDALTHNSTGFENTATGDQA